MQALAKAGAVAAALTLAWCACFPYRFTDGDSCLYAAMARDMAQGGREELLAPRWSLEGAPVCFHDDPPGAMWPAGLLGRLGLDDASAPLVANALALLALAAATWRLGGALAAGILLLHLPVLHYSVRFGLELPFAACFTAAVLAGRSCSRWAFLGLGLAAAGALLSRGVLALALVPVLLVDAALAPDRGRRLRVLGLGFALAALGALLFDRGHAAVTGHGFWGAFWEQQVLPTLQGGTPHSNHGSTILYYGGRLLLYGLPWWALGAAALWRGARQPRRELLTALVWIGVVAAGAMLGRREGSRYLFAAWPANAWLCARALAPWWRRRSAAARARLELAVAFLPLVLVAGKCLLTPRDPDWRAASALRAQRAELAAAPRPEIYGAFAHHDDRRKQFLRYHSGLWAMPLPPEGPPPGSWRLLEPAEAAPAQATRVEAPPLVLVRVP